MAKTLQDAVQIKEQESVMGEAIEREYEAREQDDMGVLGRAGEAAAAAEAYATAKASEKAARADGTVAEIAAEVAYRIDDAADHA